MIVSINFIIIINEVIVIAEAIQADGDNTGHGHSDRPEDLDYALHPVG